MILSVPEGDDKPLKYPLMFQVCQCLLINRSMFFLTLTLIWKNVKAGTEAESGYEDHPDLCPHRGGHGRMDRLAERRNQFLE